MKDVSLITFKDYRFFVDDVIIDLEEIKDKILLRIYFNNQSLLDEICDLRHKIIQNKELRLRDITEIININIEKYINLNLEDISGFDSLNYIYNNFECRKANEILLNKKTYDVNLGEFYISENNSCYLNLLINIDISLEEIEGMIFDSLFEKYPPNGINNMKMLYEKFNNLYPGNVFINKRIGLVGVYYPEIIIENSENIKHKITDLYVIFENDFHFKTFRTSGTFEEVKAGYSHSHCNSTLGKVWEMCLGYGSLKDKILCLMEEFGSKDIDEEEIEGFVYLFDNYIKWESLEGRPYKYISYFDNFYENNFRYPSLNIAFDIKKFTYNILKQMKFFYDDSVGKIKILSTNEELQEIFNPLIPNDYSPGNINTNLLRESIEKISLEFNINKKYTNLFNIPKDKTEVDIDKTNAIEVLRNETNNKNNDIKFPLKEVEFFKNYLIEIINGKRIKEQYFS